jgi:hypothetical protein
VRYSADTLVNYEGLFKEAHAELTKEAAIFQRMGSALARRLSPFFRESELAAQELASGAQTAAPEAVAAAQEPVVGWLGRLTRQGRRTAEQQRILEAQTAAQARRAEQAGVFEEMAQPGWGVAEEAAVAAPAGATAGREAAQVLTPEAQALRQTGGRPLGEGAAELAQEAGMGVRPAAEVAAGGARQGMSPWLGVGLGAGGLGLGAAGAYGYGRHRAAQEAEEAEAQRKRTRNIAFGSGLAAGVVAPHVITGLGHVARGMGGTGLFPAFQQGAY